MVRVGDGVRGEESRVGTPLRLGSRVEGQSARPPSVGVLICPKIFLAILATCSSFKLI